MFCVHLCDFFSEIITRTMEGHSKSEKEHKELKGEVEKTPRKREKSRRNLFGRDEGTCGDNIMSPSYAFPTTPRGQEAAESYFRRKRDLTPRHIERYVEYREHIDELSLRKKEIFGDRDDISPDDSDVDPSYKPTGRRSSLSDPTILGTGDDMDEEFSGFSEGSGEGRKKSKKIKLMKVGYKEVGINHLKVLG